RVPFTIYIDEFANFATDHFASILSESRKWKLSLVLCHQFLGQVPDLLRQAVFGNVDTLTAFRVGGEDAPVIAAELGLANSTALVDLPNFKAWVRISGPYDPVLIKTSPPQPSQGRLKAVKRFTRASYCRPAGLIDNEIRRFAS